MQDPLVLDSHHVSWRHLQADMVLFIVHQVIKCSHCQVQIIYLVQINIKMSVASKVTPVDSLQLSSGVVAGKECETKYRIFILYLHKKRLVRNLVKLSVVCSNISEVCDCL